MSLSDAIRKLVRDRAGDRCEYCRLPQHAASYAVFHIEHIIAKKHGGSDRKSNLALACHHCNYHKGPNLSGIDPFTRKVVRLFHPRRNRWETHFSVEGSFLRGRTAIGRATVAVLDLNDAEMVAERELRAGKRD